MLIKTLKAEIGLPIHLHTHDTSGTAAATVLAAVDAGVDAVDAAMDAMSGLTSQPCLGSIVEALRHTPRDTGLDPEAIRQLSFYWEAVRAQYAAFESDLRAGASEVYLHEMPGGQFTNLKEQARSLGLETRWHEVARAYRAANDLFGDIVKVTPSSKVVGDMALVMVSQGLSAADVLDPARDIAFPASVVEMLHGDLGQPPGGWPAALQQEGAEGRAGDDRPAGLAAGRRRPRRDARRGREALRPPARRGGARRLPDVPQGVHRLRLGDAQVRPGRRSCRRRCSSTAWPSATRSPWTWRRARRWSSGCRRSATPTRRARSASSSSSTASRASSASPTASAVAQLPARRKAEDGNDAHVAAPMPGSISTIAVRAGQTVKAGDVLLTIEAMKMETALHAPRDGVVKEVLVHAASPVDAKDLVVVLEG